jgi:hypothetical protein
MMKKSSATGAKKNAAGSPQAAMGGVSLAFTLVSR